MKKAGRIVLVLTALALVLILIGCAHSRARRTKFKEKLIYASSKKRPDWITNIPESKKYMYFVGSSPDVETLNEGKKKAVSDALRQVVNTIGVKVTAQTTQVEKYYSEKYQLEITSELMEKGEARLQGAELKDVYYEEYQKPDGSKFFRVWVLVKYSREHIKKEQERLKAILRMRYGEVEELEEKASKAEESYNYFESLIYRINASVAGLKLDEADIFFNRNITKAEILLTRLKMEKINDNQKGWVGEALPEPLKVFVYMENNGKKYPQKDVPVKFLYKIPRIKSTGYKYLVYKTKTDNNGMASFRVEKIYETSDSNQVEAYLDMSSYLKVLTDVPDSFKNEVEQFKSILKGKKVVFNFKSDTKARNIKTSIYIIQLDKDEELLPKPVVAPTIFDILYEKRFFVKLIDVSPSQLYKLEKSQILERLAKISGKSTKRIIFGYVKILNYDELSGFYIAQANADVGVYSTDNMKLIKYWNIQQTGTGETKEEARIAVFTEIGKAIGEIASRTMP